MIIHLPFLAQPAQAPAVEDPQPLGQAWDRPMLYLILWIAPGQPKNLSFNLGENKLSLKLPGQELHQPAQDPLQVPQSRSPPPPPPISSLGASVRNPWGFAATELISISKTRNRKQACSKRINETSYLSNKWERKCLPKTSWCCFEAQGKSERCLVIQTQFIPFCRVLLW